MSYLIDTHCHLDVKHSPGELEGLISRAEEAGVKKMLWVGIDVGGTFTDAVVYDTATAQLRFAKAPSTPSDPTAAVLDVLSLFPYAAGKKAFRDMLDTVHRKAVGGRYFAETTDTAYAGFDFGQKGEPSRWLTFLVDRIDKRIN